jgi:hypothetical protein
MARVAPLGLLSGGEALLDFDKVLAGNGIVWVEFRRPLQMGFGDAGLADFCQCRVQVCFHHGICGIQLHSSAELQDRGNLGRRSAGAPDVLTR